MRVIVVLFTALVLVPRACLAQNVDPAKDWNTDISVYVLAAGMSGNTTVHGIPADVDVPFSKIWDNLEATGMGRAAVWYRRWGISTDVIYMQLGATKNNVNVSFDQWVVQPVVEYKATDWLSPYVGARYLRLNGSVQGPLGRTPSGAQEWWDPVIGADLRLPASSKFALQFRGDIGGFGAGSTISGQLEPLLDWRVKKWVSIQAGYRWFYSDYKTGSGLTCSVTTCGPKARSLERRFISS
jgi:hypothetical protein